MIWRTKADIAADVPDLLKAWLFHRESMTTRLREHFSNVSVRIINQHTLLSSESSTDNPLIDQSAPAGNQNQTNPKFGLHRDVIIYGDNTPLLAATTWVPEPTYLAFETAFRELGTKPLGDLLFKDPDLSRSPFEFTSTSDLSLLYSHTDPDIPIEPTYWARRSQLIYYGHSLWITEILFNSLAAILRLKYHY